MNTIFSLVDFYRNPTFADTASLEELRSDASVGLFNKSLYHFSSSRRKFSASSPMLHALRDRFLLRFGGVLWYMSVM
jgi:hypothetical protein